MITYTDPITGESIEFETETDLHMKTAWQKIQQLKDAAEAAMDKLKPMVMAELDRHGDDIEYADGFKFQQKQNTYGKKLSRAALLDLGMDEDAVNEVMKVDVKAATDLVKTMVAEERLPRGSSKELARRVESSLTKPFPVLVATDSEGAAKRRKAKDAVK